MVVSNTTATLGVEGLIYRYKCVCVCVPGVEGKEKGQLVDCHSRCGQVVLWRADHPLPAEGGSNRTLGHSTGMAGHTDCTSAN